MSYYGITGPTGPTGNGIRYSFIDGCGKLVFVYDNNMQNTIGSVMGPTGVTGPTGATGPVGPSMQSIRTDDQSNLVVTLTDGSVMGVDNFLPPGCTVFYGISAPQDLTVWPLGIYPPPVTDMPQLGCIYINVNTGVLYSFNGSEWVNGFAFLSGSVSSESQSQGGGSVFYGRSKPTGSVWPFDTTPTPSAAFPTQGDVYINSLSGSMYMLMGDTGLWTPIQTSSGMPNFKARQMTVHVRPSAPADGYGVTLGNLTIDDGTFSTVVSSNANQVTPLVDNMYLHQVPSGCVSLVCNTPGLYDVQLSMNALEFGPAPLPTPMVHLYVVNADNQYTHQSARVGEKASFVMASGDRIVIYAAADQRGNILSYRSANNNVYLEISRRA